MMTKEKIDALARAKRELKAAIARNSGITAAKDRMKNLLYNNYEDLASLAEENNRLRSQNKVLNDALDGADRDNDALREELKEVKVALEEQSVRVTRKKKAIVEG